MIFLMVAWLSCTAVTASVRSLFISTISADSMATSVPAPMAMPTSALVRAGASLMPSPIMATFLPPSCSLRISISLSWGSTSAMAWMPNVSAMALAVRLLSPVSMMTSTPMLWKASTASLLVVFNVSARPRMPRNFSPSAKNRGVLPSSANRIAFSSKLFRSIFRSCIIFRLPPRICLPFTSASMP